MPSKNREIRNKISRESYHRRKNDIGKKEYRLQNTRKHIRRIQAVCNKIKIEAGCAICGYNKCATALEFDHIIPRKLTGESPVNATASWENLKHATENPNIRILCSNCHAEKSVNEQRFDNNEY
jgi:5-methylcytosine-specific restriction endonuclease McrA